jgi:hypothetical protein
MNLPRIAVSLLSLASSLALLSPSYGTVLVNLDFDEGYTADAVLAGQSGSSDQGLAGTFSGGALSSTATVIAATGSDDLSYAVSGGGTISSGSHVLRFESSAPGPETVFTRSLSAPLTETVYVRLVINPVNPADNSSTYLNFFINSSSMPNGDYDRIGGTGLGVFGNGAGVSPGAGIGDNFFANERALSGSFTTGTPSLLVARFNYTDGMGYTSADFFFNPAAGTVTADASANFAPGVTSLTTIGLAVANLSAASGAPIYDFDSFAVGTSWSDVVPVPEPASAVLILGGLLTTGVFRGRFSRRRGGSSFAPQ